METLIIVLVLFFVLVMFGKWKGAPDPKDMSTSQLNYRIQTETAWLRKYHLLPYERRMAANLKRMSETKHLYVDELQRELSRRLGGEQSTSIGTDEIRSSTDKVVDSNRDSSPRDETTQHLEATSASSISHLPRNVANESPATFGSNRENEPTTDDDADKKSGRKKDYIQQGFAETLAEFDLSKMTEADRVEFVRDVYEEQIEGRSAEIEEARRKQRENLIKRLNESEAESEVKARDLDVEDFLKRILRAIEGGDRLSRAIYSSSWRFTFEHKNQLVNDIRRSKCAGLSDAEAIRLALTKFSCAETDENLP